MSLSDRKRLHHDVPPWVKNGACFFITANTTPRGLNQLTSSTDVASRILNSAAHYHGMGTWWVHLFLLMPDHAHALIAIAPDKTLTASMSAWKSWQTKTLGIKWQSGFFDHRLRSDESFEEKAHYIRLNPVRKGLVERPEDWPHAWEPLER